MNDRLKALADAGVSIWLDDLSRQRLTSGGLETLIHDSHISGVTTNPTIFAKAISDAGAYAEQVSRLAAERGPFGGAALMANAGTAVAAEVLRHYPDATIVRERRLRLQATRRSVFR